MNCYATEGEGHERLPVDYPYPYAFRVSVCESVPVRRVGIQLIFLDSGRRLAEDGFGSVPTRLLLLTPRGGAGPGGALEYYRMPAAVIVDEGLKLRLAATLDKRLFVRLFRSDVPVLPGSVLGDFSPAAFPGYADQEVTGLWTAPLIDDVGRAYSVIPNLVWTRGAGGVPETEYGWVLYENPDPAWKLVAGKRLAIPAPMITGGDSVMVSVIAFLLRG